MLISKYKQSVSRKKYFFDLAIKYKIGEVATDIYWKHIDSNQYLHVDSCHAEQDQ